MFLAKKCQFFLYLDVIKIRLEILLNYFEDRKETPLTIENRIFQSPKHRHFFLYLDFVKIRLEIMLNAQ